MRNFKRLILLTVMTATLLSLSGYAQESSLQNDHNRLSIVHGDAVIQPAVSGNNLEAIINTPFMDGDRLATGEDGAAEIIFSGGAVAWIWYESKMELINSSIDESGTFGTNLKLWYGALAVSTVNSSGITSLYYDNSQEPLVIGPGTVMRLTTESDLSSVYLTVNQGAVEVASDGGTAWIRPGRSAVKKSGSLIWASIRDLGTDVFDEWYIEREKLISGAYTYSQQMPDDTIPADYQDEASSLHGYGRWITIQGTMYWAPYVASGWVPYHNGHWSHYPGWGWTWIPYEPWGWVAFHYGYWNYFFDWGWVWLPSWNWRPHYAHWRYDGRSVHWVAAHPDDPTDAQGMLLKGAIPRNSQLHIGIAVEAGQTVDEMLQSKPIRRNAIYSTPENNAEWKSTIPENLNPSKSRMPSRDHVIKESESVIQPYRNNHSPRQINRPISPPSSGPNLIIQPNTNRGHINDIQRAQPTLRYPGNYNNQNHPELIQNRSRVRPQSNQGTIAPEPNQSQKPRQVDDSSDSVKPKGNTQIQVKPKRVIPPIVVPPNLKKNGAKLSSKSNFLDLLGKSIRKSGSESIAPILKKSGKEVAKGLSAK